MKKILSAVLLALLCGSGSAFAADNSAAGPNTQQYSVGYEGVFAGDVLQGVSSRYWFNDNVGGELNLFYGNVGVDSDGYIDGNADLFLAELKMMYAPIVKQNSRFYVGLEGGIGSIGGDVVPDNVDVTVYTISPFVGTEFRFAEIPDMAFNWEVGYKWHRVNVDTGDDVNVNIDGTFVTLGAHYYF